MSATATVKGGLFETAGVAVLTQTASVRFFRRDISQLLGSRSGQKLRALMKALNGVVPGSTAQQTYGMIEANEEQGGKRTVVVTDIVNRVTDSADVTAINDEVLNSLASRTSFGSNPPANKDGNPLGTR